MRLDDSLPLAITREWLDRHSACKDQIDLFDETYPDGVLVTWETLVRAGCAGLNLEWFAQRVLLPAAYAAYDAERAPLYANYQVKRDALLANYEAKLDVLAANCKVKCAVLSDATFRAKRNVLLAEYAMVDLALYAEYKPKRDALLIAVLGAAYEKEANHGE